MDLLANELSAQEQQAMHTHLAHCPACQHELQAVQQLWHTMGNLPVPEPSEQLRPRFYSMLAEFQAAELQKKRWSLAGLVQQLQEWWQPDYATRLAYSMVLLVVGLAAGYGLRGRGEAADSQQPLAVTEAPANGNVQQAQMLTLLANPSAVQRLRAVSYAEELAPSNDRVVAALLSTLNQDPNVNVRLASLEVLSGLSQDPTVRQGLVRSLAQQESPLVQSAMADVMVQLQERRSVRPLRKLLQQENLNEQVKTKIEQSIQSLSTERSSDHSTPSTYDETNHHIRTNLDTTVAA